MRATRLVGDGASYSVNPVQASTLSPRMFQTPRQSEQQERISDDALRFDLKWRQGLGKVGAEAGDRGGIGVQFLSRSGGGSGMFARSKVLRLSWAG